MKSCHHLNYQDIDWHQLRSRALAAKGWVEKGPADWDKKAPSFSSRNKDSKYSELFLSGLPNLTGLSVLDVGSGPGTLALPLAQRAKKVTALDFSAKMLEVLQQEADCKGLTNVTPVLGAWEDDWSQLGIVSHDLVIASRSMGVRDLGQAIRKLTNFARLGVYVSDRIGATPFEPEAFAALGRPFEPGPDYIFTINTLYSMGIHPNVRILQLPADTMFRTKDEALQGLRWMFQELSDDEEERLSRYVDKKLTKTDDGKFVMTRSTPPKWALISWSVSP